METTVFKYRVERPFDVVKFRSLRNSLEHICEAQGYSKVQTWNMVSMVDELCANVVEHSDATWFEFEMTADGNGPPHLALRDDGSPFDPTQKPEIPAEYERGLGLSIIKDITETMKYSRTQDGRNEVLMTAAA